MIEASKQIYAIAAAAKRSRLRRPVLVRLPKAAGQTRGNLTKV
jgi:hypothetical protein